MKRESPKQQAARINREMVARNARLEALLNAHDEAQWECAEWHRDESEELWDTVYARAIAARNALRRELRLSEEES